jgi:hypothetical protein
LRLRLLRELVQLDQARHGTPLGEVCKADVYQLPRVDASVPVPTGGHWLWKHHSSGVDGLPYVGQVDSTCDLLDEQRRKALGSELLVNAQEVDLCTRDALPGHPDISWDTSNEADLRNGTRARQVASWTGAM